VALFGHSMGASLGFEVALRLEADGIVPNALFASDGGHRPDTGTSGCTCATTTAR
jgi:surfactin synthase thioesterase subunit